MTGQRRKALVVDDSPSIRKLISLILKNHGFSAVEAENGKDALEKIDALNIDLVITDMHMPVMGGPAFLKKLRADIRNKDIPVIGLTGRVLDMAGFASMADEWIAKPLIPSLLPEAIERTLIPQLMGAQ